MTSIYAKDVSNIKILDPYRLQELYQMHPCAEHVVKKLLVAGEREGGKDLDTDIGDCIRTLTRWQAMRAEDAASVPVSPGIDATCNDSSGRELVSRYNWKLAPASSNWIATDESGCIYAYSQKPIIAGKHSKGWTGDGILIASSKCRQLAASDWHQSLEARPQ